ncbi:PIR Superfamily Protein [Plasmodium ovale wallikeri]|uniref:PIR Superfamily Protein n=1 Tax=Plasmodium ovale wallikeri TaxID=864142 RepID=A0A1A9AG80_PLAOA|nr:PIR Superfamily Protein [Plasmodium ovale wallikeri]SBT58813.1 PIR Superfamily Protein [Plasmodium ovale wallikeri]
MKYTYDDVLKSLKTYVAYELLDVPKIGTDDEACEELIPKLSNYSEFGSFCLNLSKNIKDTFLKSREFHTQQDCEYLNYWLYHELIKNKLFDNINNISDSEVIRKIPDLWNVYKSFYEGCNLKIYNISASGFKNMKYLYDYSINYHTLVHIISERDFNCKKYYCSYIKSVMDVYNTVGSECSKSSEKDLCTIFNTIGEDKKPGVLSHKFECSTEDLNAFIIQGDKFINKIATEPGSENAASGTGLKVGFSLIGILLLSFFLLYKYTPLGNSLRLLIRSKIRTRHFMEDEENHDLSQNTWDSEDEKPQNNKLHVSYEPI